MLKRRVIPVLLWSDHGLCKPVGFQRPGRVIGSLMSATMLYENRTCDELVLLDIDATPKKRPPRFEAIKQFTAKLFCPVTIGGGIRSMEDIRGLLNAGADKVVIRTSASPNFIREASEKFGAQCIVVAIDYGGGTVEEIGSMIFRAIFLQKMGAGEFILTNKDRDGTRSGYDVDTIKAFCKAVTVPVIANGGCSGPGDMARTIHAGAHAVAASSIFLFDNLTPMQCKQYLDRDGIPVRIE